jgi:hypothetical protein
MSHATRDAAATRIANADRMQVRSDDFMVRSPVSFQDNLMLQSLSDVIHLARPKLDGGHTPGHA